VGGRAVDERQRGPEKPAPAVEGQGGPLRAETLGVHDEEADRGRSFGRRHLDGGLDEPVAEKEVIGAFEGRLAVDGPARRIVRVEVFRNFHGGDYM
jgi:hypothetical protein